MASTFESELELHELELEGELEGEGEFESEFEGELEFELEGELESEISPVRKIYPDAMMEHMAHMAAEAETEQEAAEHFLPLIGLAAKKLLPVVAKAVSPALKKALPRVARAVTRVEPGLTKGITRIAKGLHRNPATRPLLRTMPAIARRTVHSIARSAAAGRPISPRTAVRTLVQQTRRVLGTRPQRLRALKRSRIMDNRLHRHWGSGTVRPHGWQYWRTWYAGVPGAPAASGAGPVAPGAPPRMTAAAPGRPVAWNPQCNCGGQAAPTYCRCCGQLVR